MVLLCPLLLIAGGAGSSSMGVERPNVILVMSDDQGWGGRLLPRPSTVKDTARRPDGRRWLEVLAVLSGRSAIARAVLCEYNLEKNTVILLEIIQLSIADRKRLLSGI